MVVNQTIRDGQTIVSPQQNFELGFFSPGNASQNRYLGIWFKRKATGTVVWVANRETPIKSNSGELTLYSDGVLVIRESAINRVIWTSNAYGKARNPVARLFDTGNFMVIENNNETENYFWQSFDYLGDTQLPGMKFGKNLERGIVTNITSWKSVDDPSQGQFMTYMDFNGLPQVFQKNGEEIQYRLGSWNGLAFTGRPGVRFQSVYTLEYVSNDKEIYSTFKLVNSSVLVKLTLNPKGEMGRFSWFNRTQGWLLFSSPTSDSCVRFSLCGPYGSCDIEQSPPCECLKGFTPKRPYEWDLGDWKSGCQREIPLDCGVSEGFRKYSFVKLPDTRQSWFDRNMTMEQCVTKCKSGCNCTAYATLDIKYGTGCLIWYHELIDMRTFPDDGQDIYIRMASTELDKDKKVSESNIKVRSLVIAVSLVIAILLGILCMIIWKKKWTAQDFGIARNFKEDETETNTKRVVGTYGYMSPEYVGNGIISVKSDVFSFGVITLEIVSGKKNRGFSHEAHNHNLTGHAWWLYKEGKMLELVDAFSLKSNQISEVLLSIQVGLLCVQHNPNDRPNMSEVVTMLSGKGRLAEPNQPGFYTGDSSGCSLTMETQCTNNNVTITLLDGR
ncbi:hypothetical protein L1987_85077 [Smallanthus sonchifolius]|uniref:Uncharacterized protein n=1 Tax=Smallanthus sonchifolius TaxID=185202 RepID=A0ACB8XWC5_9ASTR|nr:hypothetical protein L1987_85077 [Smallanthus sonchifolius]